MKIFKRICYLLMCLSSLFCIVLTTPTLSKFVFNQSGVFWRTNFAKFTNVTEDVVLGITGQSADTPSSLFDNKATFILNDSTLNRWTNWSETGANRGETVGLHMTFGGMVTLSKVRLYHFVDHRGCDLPISIQVNYENEDGQIVTIINSKIEDLERNFDVADTTYGRNSLLRDYNNGNPLIPAYKVDGTEYYYESGKTVATIYTNCYFDEIETNNINIILQCNTNWYIGLLELAMDWSYISGSGKSYWCDKL